jgi:hypothetical protein
MKKLQLMLPVFIVLAACNSVPVADSEEQAAKISISCEDDRWLQGMIKSFEEREGQRAVITRFTYNNEIVYLVDDCLGCADAMQVVYSCSGEERCKFGGIAGFNTSPDFFEKATDKEIIWQN